MKTDIFKVAALDTENEPDGTVTAVCFSFLEKESGEIKNICFGNKKEGVDFLISSPFKVFFAHNAQYDLGNLFPTKEERDAAHLRLEYNPRGSLLFATMNKKPKGVIKFLDTLNHFIGYSIKELGEVLNFKKLSMEKDDLFLYCARDAEICFKCAEYLFHFYENKKTLDANIPLTVSAGAFALVKNSVGIDFLKPLENYPAEKIRKAYFGGLKKVQNAGYHRGEFYYLDINSAFPDALRKKLPHPGFLITEYAPREIDLDGIYDVTVDTRDMEFPTLPERKKDGAIQYPKKEFRGRFVGLDLIFAKTHGAKIKRIFSGVVPLIKGNYLTVFIEHHYAIRKIANGLDYVYRKTMLNSLYGKFAQKNEKVVIMQADEFVKKREAQKTSTIEHYTRGDEVIVRKKGKAPLWANVLWSALTTSRVRVKLLSIAFKAGIENVYLFDTDALIVNKKGYEAIKHLIGKGLGELKISDACNTSITVNSIGDYRIGDNIKISGIPKKQLPKHPKKTIKFKKPNTLKRHILYGGRCNEWKSTTYTRNKNEK